MTSSKTRESTCKVCGNTRLIWNSGGKKNEPKFCSYRCYNEYKYKEFINKWLIGEIKGSGKACKISAYVKRWVFEKAKNKCENCGFDSVHPRTKKSILQIHHKDENPNNSTPDNLVVLCPNCHALADSKNTSKGNGRRYYRKQYHINKIDKK